jgi:hypothetical protein
MPIMNNDRRLHETSSLRAFFDEQVEHLHKLVVDLGSHIHDQKQQVEHDRQIVESFVDASNSKMRAVHDYSHKLREHVVALYNHVLEIADQIPPPVNLNLDAFETDPLVNALFVNSRDIDKLFQFDHDVDVYLRSQSNFQVPKLYALLTASKSEKRILGVGMLGDVLIREVPQEVVNFSSYKINSPCASGEELNILLKKYLFGCVVAQVKLEMISRMIPPPMRPGDDSYELRVKSLANPDIYLGTLIGYLEIPNRLLRVEKIHFKLSKLGIKLDVDDKQSANEFDIFELTWSNNVKNVVLKIAWTC